MQAKQPFFGVGSTFVHASELLLEGRDVGPKCGYCLRRVVAHLFELCFERTDTLLAGPHGVARSLDDIKRVAPVLGRM